MKIEYEIKNVEVIRHKTIREGLEACFGQPPLKETVVSRVFGTFHLDRKTEAKLEAEEELALMLLEPLSQEYEVENGYMRTIAVASLPSEMSEHEIWQKLAESGYCPASFSEGISYIPMLAAKGITLDTVLHLNTILRNEKNSEFRLRTKRDGKADLVPFCNGTLKPYYNVIVVKKEKK